MPFKRNCCFKRIRKCFNKYRSVKMKKLVITKFNSTIYKISFVSWKMSAKISRKSLANKIVYLFNNINRLFKNKIITFRQRFMLCKLKRFSRINLKCMIKIFKLTNSQFYLSKS